jgi:hypothetical protein
MKDIIAMLVCVQDGNDDFVYYPFDFKVNSYSVPENTTDDIIRICSLANETTLKAEEPSLHAVDVFSIQINGILLKWEKYDE